jgi:hypothetical protein
MASLADAIEAAQARNQETVIQTARIAAPNFDLTMGEKNALGLFQRWARDRGVKAMPPAPAVVAAWIKSEAESGIDTRQIELCLEALQKVTDAHLLPSPVATAVVRAELGRVLQIQPPRSWPTSDKLKFHSLPPEIKIVISRRDQQDSKALRRLMNEAAEFRKSNSNQKEIDSNGTSDQKTA